MLPKPEKISKKTNKSPQQLDLVNTLNEGTKNNHKRFWVILLLLSSIGLSLAFSIYRWAKTFTLPQKLPSVSLNLPSVPKLKPQTTAVLDPSFINNLIGQDSWSFVLLQIDNSNVTYLGDYNASTIDYNFEPIISQLSTMNPLPDSLISNSLPQGLDFSENVITDSQFIEHQLLINLPKTHYLLISRSNSIDPDIFRSKLPQIIDSIYWRLQTTAAN